MVDPTAMIAGKRLPRSNPLTAIRELYQKYWAREIGIYGIPGSGQTSLIMYLEKEGRRVPSTVPEVWNEGNRFRAPCFLYTMYRRTLGLRDVSYQGEGVLERIVDDYMKRKPRVVIYLAGWQNEILEESVQTFNNVVKMVLTEKYEANGKKHRIPTPRHIYLAVNFLDVLDRKSVSADWRDVEDLFDAGIDRLLSADIDTDAVALSARKGLGVNTLIDRMLDDTIKR